MDQQPESARRTFRQHIAELAEQEAADDEDRREPMYGLRDRAVARLALNPSAKPLPVNMN